MDKHQQEIVKVEKECRNKDVNDSKLTVLHQTVQSISNKVIELDLVLKSSQKDIDVLRFTEHWVKEDYLKLIQLEQYKLVSYFSRKKYGHGGSYLYVNKRICANELNCFQGISMEKDFEMSAIELVDYGYIIICLYRSPDSNFWIFIKNLELIIQTVQFKERLFLCGDWNLNFLKDCW